MLNRLIKGYIKFDNGSKLQKGTTDAGLGGQGGIALRCSVDYEFKWDAGRLFVMMADGFTIREVRYTFTATPGVNDDSTTGFIVGSLWILDDGTVYRCADATDGAAVWLLQSKPGLTDVSNVITDADCDLLAEWTEQFITMVSADPHNCNIPLYATTPIPIGSTFTVCAGGAGTVTIVPEAGVTLLIRNDERTINPGGWVTFIVVATNIWRGSGDTSA